jgi:hypothetical protein
MIYFIAQGFLLKDLFHSGRKDFGRNSALVNEGRMN